MLRGEADFTSNNGGRFGDYGSGQEYRSHYDVRLTKPLRPTIKG